MKKCHTFCVMYPALLSRTGMKHVMKEWDSRQITDTLGELMTYPGAAAAVQTPPEIEMATVRQDEKPGAYPYRTETGERPDADPIKRERDLEGDIISPHLFAHSGLSCGTGPVDFLRLPRGSVLELRARHR